MVFPLLLYRRLRYGYAFRLIPLTQGKYAIVDPDDYERLSPYTWHAQKSPTNYYAKRKVNIHGKWMHLKMHREILKVPHDMLVDHINHNGLDNRKANLRPATKHQNMWNRTAGLHSSRFKGVSWQKRARKWRAAICVRWKTIDLGLYTDETEAAMAYDEAAKKYHGDFGVLNLGE